MLRVLDQQTVFVDGGWRGGIDSSGGGAGWTMTDPAREIGVLAIWNEAPPDADAVRVAWRAQEREAPVENGEYLLTWWQEPCPDDERPRVTAFRVGGDWVSPSDL